MSSPIGGEAGKLLPAEPAGKEHSKAEPCNEGSVGAPAWVSGGAGKSWRCGTSHTGGAIMSDAKTRCVDCGEAILQHTADRHNGRCAHCPDKAAVPPAYTDFQERVDIDGRLRIRSAPQE
jgi:hypothetical protein